MPVTKEMFVENYEKAVARYNELKDMGKTADEIERILVGEKYLASVLSKLFHKSGKRLGNVVKVEDNSYLYIQVDDCQITLPFCKEGIDLARKFISLMEKKVGQK